MKEETENPKLRGSCYLAIGKLGLKVPELVNKDVTMLQVGKETNELDREERREVPFRQCHYVME